MGSESQPECQLKEGMDDIEEVEAVGKPEETQHVDYVEGSIEEKKLKWKIDLYLMPTLLVLLIFNYVDRSNIGNAKTAGMDKALNMDDDDYYHALVIFQVAYVAAAIPSNMILSRVRPSIYLPVIMFLWGACSATLAAVQTFSQLLAIRFLLGIFEAGFAPGALFLISSWYKKSEQAKRVLIYFSGSILSGAFGSVVAGAICDTLEGAHSIAGWRWLFIVEGVATVGVSLLAPFALLDYPATDRKLKPEERELAVKRLRAEGINTTARATNTGSSSATRLKTMMAGHVQAALTAVKNWRIYFVTIPYMQLVGSSALTYFFPTLVNGLGYTAVKAQFMTAPIWGVALAIGIPVAYVADQVPRYRGLILAADLFLGAVFSALAAGIQDYTARYIFLCFANTAIWAGSPVAVAYASASLTSAEPEVQAISLALFTALAQLAVVYGSALFPGGDAPVYLKGFVTLTCLFFVGGCVSLAGYFLLKKFPYKGAHKQTQPRPTEVNQ